MVRISKNGEFINHFDGRTLNPGHAIERAWFILHEAKFRANDPELIKTGTTSNPLQLNDIDFILVILFNNF